MASIVYVVVGSWNSLGLGNDCGINQTFVQVQTYPDVAGSQSFGTRERCGSSEDAHSRREKDSRCLHDAK